MHLLYPPHIVFGWGARRQTRELFEELHPDLGRSPVLVTGRSKRYSEIHGEYEQWYDCTVVHYNQVPPEPTLTDLDALAEVLRQASPSAVIAVGGGSVIDTAKAAAIIAVHEGNSADYFFGKRQFSRKGIPFAALPTTAGTGAEITKNSVLIDPDSRIKQSIRHPFMVPDIAICDPELTMSMPPDITAASGLDALTQAVEAYLTKPGNHFTRITALKAVQLIYPNLIKAVEDGADRMARTAMCEGSMLTALSFSQSGLGAVHGLAHPIGSLLNVPHGRCCAILLPHILEYNGPVVESKLIELAYACGAFSAEDFCSGIQGLCDHLGIPRDFSDYGLREEHFSFIVKNCRSGSMRANPVHMPDEDVLELLGKLMG